MISHQMSGEKNSVRLLNLIDQSTEIERHVDLLRWLQGDFQYYLPHDILLTGWGNFQQGVIQHDVLSELPGARSYSIGTDTLPFILAKLHECWITGQRKPCRMSFWEIAHMLGSTSLPGTFCSAMRTMRYALIHGTRDERSNQDCLYVLLSTKEIAPTLETTSLGILILHVDAALRKVVPLPQQRQQIPLRSKNTQEDKFGLSDRETEILDWVAMGKTNSEIGMILTISAFTVKNHMQRIFQKLNVFNRAQAVSKVIRVSIHG